MSYHTEHQRLKPVLDLARQLDIATNPEAKAIFEAGNAGFQVWCTPQDHPQDWRGIQMISGAFSKACEYVGSAQWKWEDERIVALEIETSAYALADQRPNEYCNLKEIPEAFHRRTIFNREADIDWLLEKVSWLFQQAGVPLPPFSYEPTPLTDRRPFILAHYVSEDSEYVVVVSSELDPNQFCQSGYEIAHTLELWNAGEFPLDVILRPEREFLEPITEPDEGPLVETYENSVRLHEDDWLEAGFEDRISGWQE